MTADARGALVLESAGHEVRLGRVCGGGAEGSVVFEVIIYPTRRLSVRISLSNSTTSLTSFELL